MTRNKEDCLLVGGEEIKEEASTNKMTEAVPLTETYFGREETLDPTDPNHVHYETMKSLEALYTNLPNGWTRNLDQMTGSKGAPYVHVDGRTSFRHPNMAQIRAVNQRTPGQGGTRRESCVCHTKETRHDEKVAHDAANGDSHGCR